MDLSRQQPTDGLEQKPAARQLRQMWMIGQGLCAQPTHNADFAELIQAEQA